jgi:PIN domain nuclease of toxin-antitoxin system
LTAVVLLDTHVWLWWLSSPDLLSAAARKAIDGAVATDGVGISAISAWEVTLLVHRGRLRLGLPVEDWIARSEALPFIRFVPVDNAIAVRAVNFPDPCHSDPADRLIAATALLRGLPVVSKDDKLHALPSIRSIW